MWEEELFNKNEEEVEKPNEECSVKGDNVPYKKPVIVDARKNSSFTNVSTI